MEKKVLSYSQHSTQYQIPIFIDSFCPPSPMRLMWSDPGWCCIQSGLCHSWGTLSLRNPFFYKKDTSKLVQFCTGGRNHLYYTRQETNLPSSQEWETILSPMIVRDISQHPWNKADSRGTETWCRIVCQHLIVEKSIKMQNFNIYCISFNFYQVETFLAIVRKNHGVFCYSGNS